MLLKRVILFLVVTILVFGIVGGVSVVSAASSNWFTGAGQESGVSNSWYPGAGHEPGFFSPDWKPHTYNPMSEPDFLLPDWKVHPYNPMSESDFLLPDWKVHAYTPIAEPNFMYPNWTVRNITPIAAPNFMNSNWTVPKPISYRYSLIDPSRLDNYNLDPFATNDQLRAQGWRISNRIW